MDRGSTTKNSSTYRSRHCSRRIEIWCVAKEAGDLSVLARLDSVREKAGVCLRIRLAQD